MCSCPPPVSQRGKKNPNYKFLQLARWNGPRYKQVQLYADSTS